MVMGKREKRLKVAIGLMVLILLAVGYWVAAGRQEEVEVFTQDVAARLQEAEAYRWAETGIDYTLGDAEVEHE